MKIYLDSAVASSWRPMPGCPPIQGVTTNPSLIFQAGLAVNLPTYLDLVRSAGEHGMPELMLQLPSGDPSQALHWLDALRPASMRYGVSLTIKLPCHADWLPCIQALKQEDQPVLLTALSSPVQLLWAQSLDVDFVAPYVGRLQAQGRDVWALVEACVAAQNDEEAPGPLLLAASIKSPDVMARLMALGAAAVTLPPASLAAWSQDPMTQDAMDQFDQDTVSSKRFN
jgi:transaldolase